MLADGCGTDAADSAADSASPELPHGAVDTASLDTGPEPTDLPADNGPPADVPIDTSPPDVAPVVDAGPVEPALSSWHAPTSPECQGGTHGTGAVWMDDSADLSLVPKPLCCLDSSGSLVSNYVISIHGDTWTPAAQADHVFDYPSSDLRQREVQAYYGILAMVARFQPLVRVTTLPPIEVRLREHEHMSIAYYSLTYHRITIGLAGLSHQLLPARLTNHEYGHHLVMIHEPGLPKTINEALADYLAADLRDHPALLSLGDLTLPDWMTTDRALAALAGRYLERSLSDGYVYPDHVIDWAEFCGVLQLAADMSEEGAALISEERLKDCAEMTEEEGAVPEPHLTGRIVGGALWDARAEVGPEVLANVIFAVLDSGVGTDSLLEFGEGLAQVASLHYDAETGDKIRAAFAARGLSLSD